MLNIKHLYLIFESNYVCLRGKVSLAVAEIGFITKVSFELIWSYSVFYMILPKFYFMQVRLFMSTD